MVSDALDGWTVAAKPLPAAVVGAGLMGCWHARELTRAGGSLVGVADPSRDAARAVARGGVPFFPSLGELLEARSPSVVHICTPSSSHVALAEEALAFGAHVLVEKPVAPDGATTSRLLDAARGARRLLCPVYQYLFQPGVLGAPDALGRLGPAVHLEAVVCSAGGETLQDGELDALALDIAPHALAVFQRLVPGGLAAISWAVECPRPGELRAHGCAAQAGVSLVISLQGRPPRNELRVVCEGGTLELDFFHGFGYLERGGASRSYKVLRPFASSAVRAATAAANLGRRAARSEPAYPGLRTLIKRFYSATRTGSESPITADEILAVALARDHLAASASARRGLRSV
jgi:predicted dehydrogenase